MGEDEIFVMIIAANVGLIGAFWTRVSSLPRMYTDNNPGIGLLRLSVVGAVLWTAYVIQFHGDPSIEGVYVLFYLVMAYGVVKVFGQMASTLYGLHLRANVYERKNLPVALFIAGSTLATGLIFGGSVWGEADPLTDAEGGWWIPFGFFLLGWSVLTIATLLYLWREEGQFRRQLVQERDEAMAWSAVVYMVSAATLIIEGVAGDFWGWRHGILGMGTIALMLMGHEFIVGVGHKLFPEGALRFVERFIYVGLAAAAWLLNRMIDQMYVGGG